jgi:hypothetical protein
VLEWSVATAGWVELDPGGAIDDPALAARLPVAALLDEAEVDDAIASALVTRKNRVIEATRAQAKAETVIAVLGARGIAFGPPVRARILAEQDLERLDRWAARAATCDIVDDLFAEL